VVRVHVMYCDSGTCNYTFCIVTVTPVRTCILCCDSDSRTCCVLWQWHPYVFCVVTVTVVHVVYCDCDIRTHFLFWQWCAYILFVLWQWHSYMFCILTMTRLRILYWDCGMWETKMEKHWTKRSFRNSIFLISFTDQRPMSRPVCRSSCAGTEIYSTEK
jgi:hypothetical protein